MKSIYDYERDLKADFPKLSDYERLQIAAQMERNDILNRALIAEGGDPLTACEPLEAIAIALGYGPDGVSVSEMLVEVEARLREIADKLPDAE